MYIRNPYQSNVTFDVKSSSGTLLDRTPKRDEAEAAFKSPGSKRIYLTDLSTGHSTLIKSKDF